MNNREIYNMIYTQNSNYNFPMADKYPFIDKFVKGRQFILDAGCGQGNNLKRYHDQGLNIIGVEISNICCEKYLQDYPHINLGVVEFANKKGITFDCMYCFDVLEHIKREELDEFLDACVKLSDNALFGIANHSDIQYGIELHPIQENSTWWEEKLKEKYEYVTTIHITHNFYIFECGRKNVK